MRKRYQYTAEQVAEIWPNGVPETWEEAIGTASTQAQVKFCLEFIEDMKSDPIMQVAQRLGLDIAAQFDAAETHLKAKLDAPIPEA